MPLSHTRQTTTHPVQPTPNRLNLNYPHKFIGVDQNE